MVERKPLAEIDVDKQTCSFTENRGFEKQVSVLWGLPYKNIHKNEKPRGFNCFIHIDEELYIIKFQHVF